MIDTQPPQFQADRLMAHLLVLCNQIGPRPATSREERRAAEYVRETVEALGIDDVREHFFTSPESVGLAALPLWLLGLTSGLPGGRLGKAFGGMRLLLAARTLNDILRQRQPGYMTLLSQGISQNVIARIPPGGDVRQRVFLVAHLDTGKHRNLLPVPVPGLTRPLYTAALGLLAAGGLSMLLDSLRGRRTQNRLQVLAAAVSALGLGLSLLEESQPFTEGANGNGSGVAALLGLAAQLQAQPLAHTEVTLLFTGAAEAGAVGITSFLDQHAPPRHNSTFINVQMVGAGRLGYVTRHGASAFSSYRPTPQITVLAARLARENPALRVHGVDLPLVDEMAPIVEHGYEAITITGYDDQGEPSHWHRSSDMLAGIEADTLVRAARYTWEILRALDENATERPPLREPS